MSKSLQELLDDANAKLLQASVAISAMRKEIESRDKRIASLEGAARRSALPFNRDQTTPALCRPQAG